MKKQIFCFKATTIVLACALCTSAFAQTLRLNSDTTYATGTTDNSYVVADGKLYNDITTAVNVLWIRTIEDLPTGWSSAVCDGNVCYLEQVSVSPIPFTIEADSQANFDVYFYPDNQPGTGTVQVIAWVEGDSANTVIVGTFKGTVLPAVTAVAPTETEKITVYPNPAQDYILIKNNPVNAAAVEVYDMTGKKMLYSSQQTSDNWKLDIHTFVKGVYAVRIVDAEGKVFYTESFTKD